MVTSTKVGRIKAQPIAVTCLAFVALVRPASLFAQRSAGQQVPADANQLVRAVIDNELKLDQQDHSHWMYRAQKQDGEKSTVKEIVETKACDVDVLLSANGQPLSAEQRQKENDRLQKLVSDPDEQRKKMKEAQEDDQKATAMFKMLPDAFLYQYSSKERSSVKLTFTPNPNFHPPSREAQVFHAMEGTMIVDARKKRLVELDGHLAQDVQFFGGLIGHLDKGGRFSVKRAEVGPGHWETTLINVQMNGKVIIFKTISLKQTDSMTHFRQVPEDLSPPQAAEMLEKQDPPGGREVAASGAPGGREN